MAHVAQVSLADKLCEVRGLPVKVHLLEQLVVVRLLAQALGQLDRDAVRNLGSIFQYLWLMLGAGQLEHQPCNVHVLVGDTLGGVALLEVLAYFNVGHEAQAGKAGSGRGVLTTTTGLGLIGIGGGGSNGVGDLVQFGKVESHGDSLKSFVGWGETQHVAGSQFATELFCLTLELVITVGDFFPHVGAMHCVGWHRDS